jgi:DNA repair protein RecO (recombination protein O)
MRVSHVTPAIVLRARTFGESDKIVSFLTERHGKITGIAKGAKQSRKRFVNSLEPFSLVNLRFHDPPHSSLAFILAADLLLGFKQLGQSLDRFSFASYLVEITDGLIGEREENPLVFQHLRDSLRYVDDNGTSLRFLTSFELKLLSLAGYRPMLDGCKRCGNDRRGGLSTRWHFSPRDGGILCESCSRSRKEVLPLGAKAVAVLTDLQAERSSISSRASLPSSVVNEIRSVVLRFIQFHMEKEIKSAPFLWQFSSMQHGLSHWPR